MNPSDFIDLSSSIVTKGSAGARSAISRAYYGAYHQAKECLHRLGADVSANDKAHTSVPQYLQSESHGDAYEAGSLLSDLHSERIVADYKLANSKPEGLEFAKSCVELAVEVVTRLKKFETDCSSDEKSLERFREHVKKVKLVRCIR